jgi:autotransporter-associated beta strand protein
MYRFSFGSHTARIVNLLRETAMHRDTFLYFPANRVTILRASLALAAAFALCTSTFAATWTWDGGAPGNQWNFNFGQNWNPDTLPANNGTADLIFGGTTRLAPDLNGNWSVNSVTFNNTAGQFDLTSLGGSTLTVGAGGITNNDATTQVISHALTLSAPQTWNAASGRLVVNGAVNNGGNLLTINTELGPSFLFNGVLTGSGGLTKNGPGDLSMQIGVANTYAGMTTVNAGLLTLSGGAGIDAIPGSIDIGDGVGTSIDALVNVVSNKIADSASVSVFSTGTWSLTGILNSSETITNLNIVSTGIAGGGSVTIGSRLEVLGNMTMTGGTVSRAAASSLLRLNGDLTTNAAAIAASISSWLDLGSGARTFTIADGAALVDLDVTDLVTNGGIVKNGPGTLRLGWRNIFSHGTTLNAGTILIGHDAALGTGPLTANGGTIRADGEARTIANAVSGTLAVDGPFDLALNSPVNGDIAKSGPGTLVFAKADAITNSLTVNTGAVRVDAPVTFAAGLTNSATLLLGTQTLTVNGAGFDNQSSLALTATTLTGSGPIINSGHISGYGAIDGSGGFTNSAQLTVSGGNLTLAKAGTNANRGNVEVPAGLQLRLTGGTLANSGTVNLIGGIVAGTATLSNNAGGIVSGRGLISAPFANSGGMLRSVGGTINVTTAFTNSGVIRLDDAAGLAGGAITNTGLIQGDGAISNALTNAAGGSIRVDVGKILFFTGAFAPNAGEMNLQGGTLDFADAIINSANGYIAGRGALYTDGLTNNGAMAFSGGNADIHGDVTLTAGSRMVTSGSGATTTFFDDVTHNGAEIFTGAGASSVFFGALSGAGSFTGTGAVYSIGDLRPGNSPAAVNFGGSLVLGSSTSLMMELGGATPGAQYDRLMIAGSVSLAGALNVMLIDGFTPAAGNSFDILDWGTLSGAFSTVTLPTLNGLTWNTSQLYTTGVISLAAAGLPGDYNQNGTVDAADYVVWRSGLGTTYTQTDYDVWRANFGRTAGTGASTSGLASVPEPTSCWLCGTCIGALLLVPTIRSSKQHAATTAFD